MTVLILAALCFCSASLVVAAWLLTSHRGSVSPAVVAAPEPPPQTPPPQPAAAPVDPNLELIESLQILMQLVREQVGEHSASVSGVGESLRKAQAEPASGAVSGVLDALNVLLDKNNQLQERLNAADRELCRQTEMLERQRHAAQTDPLTGLHNRRAFDEQLQAMRKESSPVGIVLLDLDHFKRVNDTHGHAAGDAVLVETGKLLQQAVREGTFVARMGGEEFAILVPQATSDALAHISLRVRAMVEQTPVLFEGKQIAFTASFGAAVEQPGELPTACYQRADQASYASKQAGRNRCHIHTGTSIELIRHTAEADDTAKAGVPIASRIELMTHVRRHLLESDLDRHPLTLVLLRIESQDLGGPVFQGLLQSVQPAFRDDDLIAECDPQCVALLLLGASLDPTSGPMHRLHQAIAAWQVAHEAEPFDVALGAAQAALTDDCISLVQRAEASLERAQLAGR